MNRRNFVATMFGGLAAALGVGAALADDWKSQLYGARYVMPKGGMPRCRVVHTVTEVDHAEKSITLDSSFDSVHVPPDQLLFFDAKTVTRDEYGMFYVEPGRERPMAAIRNFTL